MSTFITLAILLILGVALSRGWIGIRIAPRPRTDLGDPDDLPNWIDDRERTDVVGESNYQSALARLAKNRAPNERYNLEQAVLLLEDGNRFDPLAVAVYIDGRLVGYLSRADARRFRKLLVKRDLAGQRTACKALVRGGGVGREGQKLNYGVQLLFDLDDGCIDGHAQPKIAVKSRKRQKGSEHGDDSMPRVQGADQHPSKSVSALRGEAEAHQAPARRVRRPGTRAADRGPE